MISSHLPEDGPFSAAQVCHYWRTVLISSPSLWTRFSCCNVPQTAAGLDRCGSLPIHLNLERLISGAALRDVLHRGNEVASLNITYTETRIPPFRLFLPHARSLERLSVYDKSLGRGAGVRTLHEVWRDFKFPSLRELFAYRYLIPLEELNAPNLVHLALEEMGSYQIITTHTILKLLRRIPLLETLLISDIEVQDDTGASHSSIPLPHLRSIEVGGVTVLSGFIACLDFPTSTAVALRDIDITDICEDVSPDLSRAMQCVFGRIDVRCITIATPSRSWVVSECFVRFEGVQGSLEITTGTYHCRGLKRRQALFSPQGILFLHKPHIKDVRELHIAGCSVGSGRQMDHINAAMPNLISISFFRYGGPHTLELLTPPDPPFPPFPRLRCVMILGTESGLEEMARERRDLGVPIKTLIIGRGPEVSKCDRLEDYGVLESLVDNLWVGCPAETFEWTATGEIHNLWSPIRAPHEVGLMEIWRHHI